MNRKPTHYDVLGVPQTATAAEIRSAYIGLMKQHHPDATAKLAGERGAGMAPLVNRCYAILRDSRKRADYDAHLAVLSEAPVRRQLARPVRSAAPDPAWHGPAFIGIAACLVGALLVMPVLAGTAAGGTAFGSIEWLSAKPRAAPPDLVLSFPASEDIRRQALAATSVNTGHAIAASEDCFAKAEQQGTFSAAALCIAFDEAFLYWRKAPGLVGSLPAYFADDMVNMREASALQPFGAAGEAKLDEIRRRAFLALLDHVNSDGSAFAAEAAPPARASYEVVSDAPPSTAAVVP